MKKTVLCRDIGAAATLLRDLANPDRLAIVCLLLEGECSVAELEAVLGIRQPTLSQQIAVLRQAGLIQGRRRARNVCYRVESPEVRSVVQCLRGLYAELLPASVILAAARKDLSRKDAAAATAAARLAELEAM